jgi:7,8-dihydropterin-6-yl-methyl-4-(beta-D-ribofuranosyl)aminobenzene 5'-phosphate synthase
MENYLVGHRGLQAEHGLSILIEDEGSKILFDTGSSPLFLENAEKLNKNLHDISSVVLSHAHYDHTGGFPAFISQWKAENRNLYTGIDFFADRFEENSFSFTYLGNSFSKKDLEEKGIVLNSVSSRTKLSEHCSVVSGYTQRNSLETVSPKFQKSLGNSLSQDIFSDECSIVVETAEGLQLIVGCAHIGILNIVEHVSRLFSRPVTGVYGGIHLMNSSRQEIQSVLTGLSSLGVRRYGLCHCSGSLVSECLNELSNDTVSAKLGPGSMLFW